MIGKADSQFFDDDDLSRREFRVQQSLGILLPKLQNRQAQRHLNEGLGRRLFMMEHNRMFVRDQIGPNRTQMLDRYLSIEINVQVNSFYSNMSGALDNLAWAILYELQMRPNPDEESWDDQRYCSLFKQTFLNDLRLKKPELAALLQTHSAWSNALKQFRDPGAHRIPLYVPPGVVDPKDGERANELRNKAFLDAAANQGRIDKAMMAEADKLVRFEEVMVLSGPQMLKTVKFTAQMVTDHNTLLEICEGVLDRLS